MLSLGCDAGSGSSGTSSAETDAVNTAKKIRVGKGVDGATPALPGKNEDMALVAKEAKQNEVETTAARQERDEDLSQIEAEKISNQTQ